MVCKDPWGVNVGDFSVCVRVCVCVCVCVRLLLNDNGIWSGFRGAIWARFREHPRQLFFQNGRHAQKRCWWKIQFSYFDTFFFLQYLLDLASIFVNLFSKWWPTWPPYQSWQSLKAMQVLWSNCFLHSRRLTWLMSSWTFFSQIGCQNGRHA